ncbi:MAG: RNA polymerase factor sigma-54 [Proteobacteria bacterium]|nr:RNA polymerase factor sigma-54 [Pseudomonadota bacterium]MBU1964266.1 RNA polymerase factor sigma-54 [Pseudomonadota bacterium]
MAFELRQNLKLTQQLIMTPQLQQAIKLLQLSRLDLVDMVNQEMEENPLLEEVVSDEDPEAEKKIEPAQTEEGDREEGKTVERTGELTGEGDGREEFDWDGYLEDYGPMGVTYDRQEGTAPSWDNLLVVKSSLTDHLMWQLLLSQLTEAEYRIGEQIIGNLDQNGYLAATLDEICVQEKVTADFVEEVLKKIQEFDPVGIAARDLRECLLIQAKMVGNARSLVERIILGHLKDLEVKNYPQIARKLKVSIDDVLAAVVIISHMDPHPGSIYNEERIQAIVPDVYVFKSGDDYKIVLNDEGLPRLRISNFYREIMGGMKAGVKQENGKKYIKERVQSATWLIKSIQQRQKTIYRVTESIVRFQREFFERGINSMKPLILREIADDVEMHESTISRVVTNKYMHTPRGLFELKYFFGSGIRKPGSDDVSSKSVQDDIRKIIGKEDPRKPFSDQVIVARLGDSGISIARRTVAKYREMMGILPSSMRKKYF